MSARARSASGSDGGRSAGSPAGLSTERTQSFLRVLRGEPTAEELAAVVVVLTAHAAAESAPAARPRSAWADPGSRLRGPLRPCPQAWRRSSLPGRRPPGRP